MIKDDPLANIADGKNHRVGGALLGGLLVGPAVGVGVGFGVVNVARRK